MTKFFRTRNTLKNILQTHTDFAKETKVNDDVITDVIEHLKHGEMSIAVVGVVNRGKSTFLNALLGTKLFPSSAVVCTAGVTVLDHGDKPKAEIIYKNGKIKSFELPSENPANTLVDIVSRKNKNVQDIKMVRIWFPNPFTGNGLVLVDTPGVDDPDTWREDITYEYLAGADAVIMLLDPMMPLSASEVEFLEHKILGRSIANLIFVVNRIDDVSIEDRAVALGRIENILKKYVPNPTIYPLASKPALKAKQTGNEQSLNISGFPEFEEGLLDFLAKGRSGLLLKSKIQKGRDHLREIHNSIISRINALNSEKKIIISNLDKSKLTLKGIEKERDDLRIEMSSRQHGFKSELHSSINIQESHFNSKLEYQIRNELDETKLKNIILEFQKKSIERLDKSINNIIDRELKKYGDIQKSLIENIGLIFEEISSVGEELITNVNIEKLSLRSKPKKEPLYLYLIQWINTGFGWFVNNVLNLGPLEDTGYIEETQLKNNQSAIEAVEDFISKMYLKSDSLAKNIVDSLLEEIIKPINRKVSNQKNLISQIEDDLNQTVEDQQSTRDFLASKTGDVNDLDQQYSNLITSVESL